MTVAGSGVDHLDLVESETLGIGAPAGRHQELVGGHGAGAALVAEIYRVSATGEAAVDPGR